MNRQRGSKPRQQVKTKYFPFVGGLNLVDPPLSTPDGMLLGVSNFELRVRGGYRRVDGIERFDGHASPSDAIYYVVPFDAGINEPVINSIIVGQTSLAHGHLLDIQVDSGSFATNDAAGLFAIHIHKGAYLDNENLVEGNNSFSIGFDNGFQ